MKPVKAIYITWDGPEKNCIKTPQPLQKLHVMMQGKQGGKLKHLPLALCVVFDTQNNYSVC